MTPQRVRGKGLPNLTVPGHHGNGNRGPVKDMASRAGQCLDGSRVGAGEGGRHVADHPARSCCQGQLDHLVKIWANVPEQALDLRDGNLADQLVRDVRLPPCGPAPR